MFNEYKTNTPLVTYNLHYCRDSHTTNILHCKTANQWLADINQPSKDDAMIDYHWASSLETGSTACVTLVRLIELSPLRPIALVGEGVVLSDIAAVWFGGDLLYWLKLKVPRTANSFVQLVWAYLKLWDSITKLDLYCRNVAFHLDYTFLYEFDYTNML